MLDFLMISTRANKRGEIEVYPKFIIKKSQDLMIRGGDFYAIWMEDRKLWSTDEDDVTLLIDSELRKYVDENTFDGRVNIQYMWDASSGVIDSWHKYCQKQLRDNFHSLDESLTFSNTDVKKTDYASKILPYPLAKGNIDSWDKIISTLYSESERHKIEWSIGAILTGDSKHIQKFMVFYGSAGTGKSTILNIIQSLFDGYYSVFDAKALGSSSNSFALEAFKTNPLVAIQHDGDLSRIEDNTRINSLVSHELMTVNEKYKSTYSNRFKTFLYMGTNKPVKITDAKSGIIRRLIDVSPTGNKLPSREYKTLIKKVEFELGAIAYYCKEVYLSNPSAYDDYIPITMMGASNDFYNFVLDSYHIFKRENGTTLKAAWEMYKNYCEEAKVGYPFSQRVFKEELRAYFDEYSDRFNLDNGGRVRSYYHGFKTDKFEAEENDSIETQEATNELTLPDLNLNSNDSIFDTEYADCFAQYANDEGNPINKWDNVKTKLSDLDTTRLHWVRTPPNHIVIDFDLTDDSGNKSLEKNIEAASKWPSTYTELSKGGQGLHLHYIFDGDVTTLSRLYDDKIEIKVYNGKSSLRRKLTKCNNLPIAIINSGLPTKRSNKMLNKTQLNSERSLRMLINRNLAKDIMPGTKPSIDFIHKILEDAYASDLKYDVSDMYNSILVFALNSTNQSEYCIKKVRDMKLKSEEMSVNVDDPEADIVFYDVEVFSNLFVVCYKRKGKENPIIRLINPKPSDIEELIKFRLVGFNNRSYDNHILYARLIGYSNEQLYSLSQRIINNEKNVLFREAYNLSYSDIYDFASAGNKMGLKKLEIVMGIHHQELGLPWDKPVDKSLWDKVAEYCDNDVIATEEAFSYLSGDWMARRILADLANMTVNDTTNTLTTKFIFGNNRNPQSSFQYRDMSKPVFELPDDVMDFLKEAKPKMMSQTHGDAKSLLPYFPGYEYKFGKSYYRDVLVGEGGRVYGQPGMYSDVALLDVVSMHPNSTIAECLFGPTFTRRFKEIVDGRVSIKHEAWDIVDKLLGGVLSPYIKMVKDGLITTKQLSDALKTAINSVYGLTSASFDNPFKDRRNVDNIVAKRGALFMIDLHHAILEQGYDVAHIKTDSVKIPNADDKIIKFVMEFGERYGYEFEHEETYDRLCLVNDAVYIARYGTGKKKGKWTATGTQFAVPYVFKTLFSKEPIEFSDLCETKSVRAGHIVIDMNEQMNDVSHLEDRFKKLDKKYRDENGEYPMDITLEMNDLKREIDANHAYNFVGRVGQFCPIKDGCGGGVLYREKDNKYFSVTGTSGYRWLESEIVETMKLQDSINHEYYKTLVDKAVESISEYGDFEWFVSNDVVNHPPKEIPPWLVPCGDGEITNCYECPHIKPSSNPNEKYVDMVCSKGYDISDQIPF